MSKPEIVYFDIRARAEPIRLILEELGIEYEDTQIRGEEWPALKPKTAFARLPAYRESDHEIWQSHAIYRHLARVHGLYGSDEKERTRCDVVEEALADLNNLIGGAPWRPNFPDERQAFLRDELRPFLHRLERFLETNEAGPSFWVGADLTFVDLVAFSCFDCTAAMYPEVPAGVPLLQEFCDGIAKRPRIAAYLASARRPPAAQYGPAGKIYRSTA